MLNVTSAAVFPILKKAVTAVTLECHTVSEVCFFSRMVLSVVFVRVLSHDANMFIRDQV